MNPKIAAAVCKVLALVVTCNAIFVVIAGGLDYCMRLEDDPLVVILSASSFAYMAYFGAPVLALAIEDSLLKLSRFLQQL